MLVPMSVIVQKYGGSSVADVQKLKAVAARVMQTRVQGHDVVVVVSAMGDTTDELLTLAKQVSPNPDRRELDMLLSAGERISMALLSMAIRELGGNAISFTGSQSGIITNDRHVDARIIEVRPFRIQDELSRGRIVVVAGYQGLVVIPSLRETAAPQALEPVVLRPVSRGEEPAVQVTRKGGVSILSMDVNSGEPGHKITFELAPPPGASKITGSAQVPPAGTQLLLVLANATLQQPGAWTLILRTTDGAEMGRYPFRIETK